MLTKKKTIIILLVVAIAFFGIYNYALTDYHDDNNDCCEEEIQAIQQQVFEARDELMEEGNYFCCLNNPCTQCFVNMPDGQCPCGENALEDNGPVCHECKGGWLAGDGAFEDIDPEDLETMPRGEEE